MTVDLRTIWSGIYPNLSQFSDMDIQIIKAAVFSELGKYDFTVREQNTELAQYDGENVGYQMFFLAKKVEGLSNKSLEYYKNTVDKLVERLQKPLVQITTDDIRFYFAIRQTQDKVSVVTVENERRNLNSFFSWLTEENYIVKNPVLPIKRIKSRKVKKKAFTDTELQKIKDTCGKLTHRYEGWQTERRIRDAALIEFLISTACRVGEIDGLKREDVDIENRTITVIGKGNKERTVYLSPIAKMRLLEYWECVGESEYCFCRLGYKDKFPAAGIEKEVAKIGKTAKVPKCHPHRFRRTSATMALKKGMTIIQVQKMLGHENLETTKIYLDLDDSDLKYQHDKYF